MCMDMMDIEAEQQYLQQLDVIFVSYVINKHQQQKEVI